VLPQSRQAGAEIRSLRKAKPPAAAQCEQLSNELTIERVVLDEKHLGGKVGVPCRTSRSKGFRASHGELDAGVIGPDARLVPQTVRQLRLAHLRLTASDAWT
jgi:hypothetical protein